jgi:ParB family chromosome partitioning protein
MNFNKSEEARRNRMAAMVDDEDEGGVTPAPASADPYAGRKQLREACAIRVDRIAPDPEQPRKEFDPGALARLAESLKARGQLQPIRVRWDEGRGVYVVVVGERRWRAARLAGLETVACVVISGAPTAAELLEDQLVENALREDLKPVEQARAFRTLMRDLGLTQQQLADKLQISQTTVSQALSLLDLPAPAQARVDAGELAPSAAYQIAKVKDPAAQSDLVDLVVSGGLSRAETAEAVRRASGRAKTKGNAGKARRVTRRTFRKAAGCTVTVENARGLDHDVTRAALAEALARLDAELGAGDQAAA